MLINTSPRRPKRGRIGGIKQALRAALGLSDDMTVMVTELVCPEQGCAPVETVVALLRPDAPPVQHKMPKSTEAVDAEDLVEVCKTWGFDAPLPVLTTLLQENSVEHSG